MTTPEVDDLAAPLDALPGRRCLRAAAPARPDLSVAKVAGLLVTRPGAAATRLRALAAELARVGLGTSELAPAAGDRRFTDPAWTGNRCCTGSCRPTWPPAAPPSS